MWQTWRMQVWTDRIIPREMEHMLWYIPVRELSPLFTSLTSPQEDARMAKK